MFRLPEAATIHKAAQEAQANYVIQINDLLTVDIYTNKGEKIIDPAVASLQSAQQASTKLHTYLVDHRGMVKFPLINEIKVDGYTLREAEQLLTKEYEKYYSEPFVVLTFQNKRVVVLGALGGQVIPLANENIRLTEILALSKGIGNDAKVANIRILRGDQVFVADLSTIAGYQQDNIVMQPNDIVYVEPVRRPVTEAVRDYGPVLSIVTSLATIVIVLMNSNNNAN